MRWISVYVRFAVGAQSVVETKIPTQALCLFPRPATTLLIAGWRYVRGTYPYLIRKLVKHLGLERPALLGGEPGYRFKPSRYRPSEQSTKVSLSYPLESGERDLRTRGCRLTITGIHRPRRYSRQRLLHRSHRRRTSAEERCREGATEPLPFALLRKCKRHLR